MDRARKEDRGRQQALETGPGGCAVSVPSDFLFWYKAKVVNVVDGDTLDLEIGAPLFALCR